MTRRSLSVMSALHALTMHRGRGDSANVMPAEKLPTTARTCPDLALEASPSLRGHVLGRFRPLATTLPVPLERIGGLDALRIIAAVGIVWFHTEGAPYRQVGYAGLPIFLVIFFCLITRRSSAETAAHFLRRRATVC